MTTTTPPGGARFPTAPLIGTVTSDRTSEEETPPTMQTKEQLKVWVEADTPGRVRAAFMATREETGDRSVSDLVERAVEKELRLLARKHHDGAPWEPLAAGRVPTGRPAGG